jgi:hypothetical protein
MGETSGVDRNILAKKLKVSENQESRQLPLLYSIFMGMLGLCFGINNIRS